MGVCVLKEYVETQSGRDEYILGFYKNEEYAADAMWDAMAYIDKSYPVEFIEADEDGKIRGFYFYTPDGMEHVVRFNATGISEDFVNY